MSRSILTLETQIEDDIKNIAHVQYLIALQKEKLAHVQKPRQEPEKYKLQHELVGFYKTEQDLIKALRVDRLKLAEYQHNLDLAEKESREAAPLKPPPSDVVLEEREQNFLNQLK